jgi:Na+-driven multidrug efflux pump
MGAGNKENAERILTGSWSMLTMTGIMLTGVILLFAKPLLWLFGASNATIVYASDYLSIYLFGTVFVQTAVGMNPFINTQGFAKFGMLTVVIGALVNLILDPILIFGLNMGVKGAALATIIAQGVSATWVISFLRGKRSKLHLRVRYLIPSRKIASHVIGLGISPFIMQSTESLVLISLNTQLVRFGGDIAVGSMTIMNSILQVINLPMQGIAQGAQPIISFNYGANQLERVRDTIKLAFKVALSYNILLCGILMLFPSVFVKIFNDHPELVATTSRFIRIYFIGFSIFGAQIIAQQTFVALGTGKNIDFHSYFT